MPAERIASASPWHVVFIIDDSGSMKGKASAQVNIGLESMLSEMEVRAKGTKPYFKVSVIAFGSNAEILAEAQNERAVVGRLSKFSGSRGGTRPSGAFRLATEILTRNPGAGTDFRPYVFFLSDGRPDDEDRGAAVQAAASLKQLSISAGEPTVFAIGYGDVDEAFMRSVCSNKESGECFSKLPDVNALLRLFPLIGSVAGTRSGESAIDTGIMNL
jgi:uncharacterized protein YegL